MANWYGAARTNYVTIEDLDAVLALTSNFSTVAKSNKDGKWAFFPNPYSDGDFNYSTLDAEDTEIVFNWEDIMPYVKEGEVLVVMASGAEKLRYITGDTQAYIRMGSEVNSCSIRLTDIYALASETFGVGQETITITEY